MKRSSCCERSTDYPFRNDNKKHQFKTKNEFFVPFFKPFLVFFVTMSEYAKR